MLDFKKIYEELDLTERDVDKLDKAVRQLCESKEIDEGIKDTLDTFWCKMKSVLSSPADCLKKVLDKDRELIKKTEENLKRMPKKDLAAIYSAEFADANIVDDVIDMIAMLKDVLLLRYKYVPWRTAISACILLAYILRPYNVKLGSGLVKYIGRNAAKAGAVVAKLTSFLSKGTPLGTEMMPKINGVNTFDFDFGKAIDDINNGKWDPKWAQVAQPYLNCLDEICIIYLLWKWFRRDLKKYRMWKAAKIKSKQQLHMDNEINEDAMVAAAPAGGGEIAAADSSTNGADLTSPEHGTSVDDVLGKCDHKHDGYLGPKCFHVPMRVGKLHKRIELPGTKKKKRQKNPYTNDAVLLSDAELTQDMIIAVRQLSNAAITKFIKDEYNCAPDDEIRAIAYFPEKKICFIKFKKDEKWAYAAAVFDGEKFVMTDSIEREILTSKQVEQWYIGINKIKPQIIWGKA